MSIQKVVIEDVMKYARMMIHLTLVDMTRIKKRQPYIHVKNTSRTLQSLTVSWKFYWIKSIVLPKNAGNYKNPNVRSRIYLLNSNP